MCSSNLQMKPWTPPPFQGCCWVVTWNHPQSSFLSQNLQELTTALEEEPKLSFATAKPVKVSCHLASFPPIHPAFWSHYRVSLSFQMTHAGSFLPAGKAILPSLI